MRVLCAVIMACLLQISNQAQASPPYQQTNPDAYVATGDGPLRLRAGPGLNHAVLDLLDDGTPLTILGRTSDSTWLEVHTLDQLRNGWVFGEYVDVRINLNRLDATSGPLNFRALISNISPNAHHIYQQGQQLGNRANVFAKVGDSITVSYHMLQPIGEGHYELGDYDYLQPAIDFFSEADVHGTNAFAATSVTAQVGWTAAAVLMPQFADPSQCQLNESPLVCEYRLTQPAFALIMLGTNDTGYVPAVDYQHNLERIIDISIEMGVVPVLSTIPPRTGYEDTVLRFNQIVRDVARRYDIPLWDYHYAMAYFENTSLTYDGVHPSLPPRGHDDVAIFKQANLPYGYVLRNLSALHVLDALWQQIVLEAE